MNKLEQRELADELEMYASQIRENADNRQNFLPTIWVLDDWMAKFRDLCQEQNERMTRQLFREASKDG